MPEKITPDENSENMDNTREPSDVTPAPNYRKNEPNRVLFFIHQCSRFVLSFFFSNRCGFCGKPMAELETCCDTCEDNLPLLKFDPEPPENVSDFYVCCSYSRRAREAVLSMKIEESMYPAEAMAVMMAKKLDGVYADALVPVPSTLQSLLYRWFTPAGRLAELISIYTGLPVCKCLKAKDEKLEQKTLTAKGRIKNAMESFYFAPKHHDIRGKTLILVDDVSTTGSTLAVLAGILRAEGAADVKAIVFAKTIKSLRADDQQDLILPKPKGFTLPKNKRQF